jgi:hypothetical protein
MVNTKSIAIAALAIVLLSIAAGTITWFLVDDDDDSSTANVVAPAGVQPPLLGSEFHYKLKSNLSGTAADASIYADVWGASNAYNGRLRYDEVYPDPDPSVDDMVSTTIFRFDESPPAEYTIRTMPGDVVSCIKKDLTQAEANHVGANTNTAIQYQTCIGEECYWYVWDGSTAMVPGRLSNQKYITDKSTGTIKRMRHTVCTKSSMAECEVANQDYMHCQCADNPHSATCCNDDSYKTGPGLCTNPKSYALSSTCGGCASWPPADEEDFCGSMPHWFGVSEYQGASFDYTNTPLFQTPVASDGSSLCVAYDAKCDRNSASYDPIHTCAGFPSSNGAPIISETASVNTPATGFKKVFATPASAGANAPAAIHKHFETEARKAKMLNPSGDRFQVESSACGLIFFSTALRNACYAYMASGGKYGRYCGKSPSNGNRGENTPSGTCSGDYSVCNDGGFDACCKNHDGMVGGVHKRSEDVVGLLTILECGVDKEFKKCRTANTFSNGNRAKCGLAANDMGNWAPNYSSSGNCAASLDAANTLFNVLPCSTWTFHKSWWRGNYWDSSWNWKWGNY